MKQRAIAKVVVDSSGRLFVSPKTDDGHSYEYIYREANGLRWDQARRALCAYEPSRWRHEELLQHMATTLCESCDEELTLHRANRMGGHLARAARCAAQSARPGVAPS